MPFSALLDFSGALYGRRGARLPARCAEGEIYDDTIVSGSFFFLSYYTYEVLKELAFTGLAAKKTGKKSDLSFFFFFFNERIFFLNKKNNYSHDLSVALIVFHLPANCTKHYQSL